MAAFYELEPQSEMGVGQAEHKHLLPWAPGLQMKCTQLLPVPTAFPDLTDIPLGNVSKIKQNPKQTDRQTPSFLRLPLMGKITNTPD